jgi:hypothetical protein
MIELSPENVMRFVLLRARMKSITKKEKQMSAAIKEAMNMKELEELAPKESPFKLIYRESERTEADYQQMAERAYRRLYGREWVEKFDKDKEAYGKQTVVSLEVEPNERFKQS